MILCHFMTLQASTQSSAKRARTRDLLLVAAQDLLMERSAAGLGIRQITDRAGLVHASFYNYYPDIAGLIADLAELLGATHAVAMTALAGVSGPGFDDPAVRFSRVTRQTLRFVALEPGLGRLMFDVGLPVDSLSPELRLQLKLDLEAGARRGLFRTIDPDLTVSLVAGAISGLALDLHRGVLKASAIDAATARLLGILGLGPDAAGRLASEPVDFPSPPKIPLRWLALPVAAPPLNAGSPPQRPQRDRP
jgi:AcrR family transcriptional regulator